MRTTLLGLTLLASPALAQFQHGDLVLSFWNAPVDLVHAQPDGTVIQTWVTADSAGITTGAAIALDGRAVTVRLINPGISLFDHAGSETSHAFQWGIVPGDVAVFPNGEIAVADPGEGVRVFDPDGTLLRTIVSPIPSLPYGLHVDSGGSLWVSDISSTPAIREFAQDGTLLLKMPINFQPVDLVRARGTIWTIGAKFGHVRQLALDGTVLTEFPTVMTSGGSGLALDLDGTLLVSTSDQPRVFRYGTDGTLLETLEFPDANPGGVFFLDVHRDKSQDIGSPYCGPANPNSSGLSALISAQGSEQVAINLVVLHAAQLPANQFGYFLNSMTKGFIANPPGSQGNLCLDGAIGRYSTDVANTGPLGELQLTLDLQDTPTPGGPVAIQPGETWNFQCWFRDKNPGATSNFTNGLSIQFL
jgi:hypothetical protein